MGKCCDCKDRIKLSKLLIRLHIIKKKGYITMKYDFDYLKNLYIEDPDEFEKVTSTMINDAIDSMPEERREIYRARQWKLEQTLNKIKDPLERMNRMVAIFWEGVNEFVEEDEKIEIPLLTISPEVEIAQKKRLSDLKQSRDEAAVTESLAEIKSAGENGNNLMPVFIKASHNKVTLGEMVGELKEIFGTYEEIAIF